MGEKVIHIYILYIRTYILVAHNCIQCSCTSGKDTYRDTNYSPITYTYTDKAWTFMHDHEFVNTAGCIYILYIQVLIKCCLMCAGSPAYVSSVLEAHKIHRH